MALNKRQQDFLNKLAEDETLVYRGFIKRFILVNTHEPTYQVGDYVRFSDPLTSVYGQRVRNFNGKVVKIRILAGTPVEFKNIRFLYEIQSVVDGKKLDFYADEFLSGETSDRPIHGKSTTDVNVIQKKNDIEQCMDVII